jgi:Flp pilus assembly protein TadD
MKSMTRKPLTAALVTVAMLLTVSFPRWSAISAGGLNLDEPDVETSAGEKPKKQGNSLGKALSAPFRALGSLFGGSKKNNQRLSQITDKDIAKFEGRQVTRVNDARTPTVPAASKSESSPADHLQRGRNFLKVGQLSEAIGELSLAASLDPKSGEAQTLLGVAYDRKGLRDRAQQAFEAALNSPDDQAMHLNNLGYWHYKNGNYEAAVKYLKRAAKAKPDDQRIWNNLGMAQCGAGRFDDGYKSFVHAIGEFQARLKVAAYLERQGLTKDAIKQLEKARKLKPDSTEVLAWLAALYDSAGRFDEAIDARAALSALRTAAATSQK